MQDFSVEGGPQNVGGATIRRWNEILLLGKALKFGVNFQNFPLKFKKLQNNWENSRKNATFSEFFLNFMGWNNF